jgi:coenzyme F420-reducing hydrogenase delta subunit
VTVQSLIKKLFKELVIETNKVLTMVVSTVERKRLIHA